MVLDPTSSFPALLPRGPWWVRSGPGLAWKAGGGGLLRVPLPLASLSPGRHCRRLGPHAGRAVSVSLLPLLMAQSPCDRPVLALPVSSSADAG